MLTNVLRRLRSKLGMIHTIDWGFVAAKICPDFGLCRRVGWRLSGRGWRRVVRRQCCGWRPGRGGHFPGPDPAGVFAVWYVADPVDAVLDRPMLAGSSLPAAGRRDRPPCS